MDHPLSVGVVEGQGGVARDGDGLLDRKGLLAVEPVAEGLALHVRHDVEEELVSPAGVVQRQDVGVVQLGGDLDFSQEPVRPDGGRQLGSEHLDGHLPAVLEIVGEVDRGHPPAAELPLDGVAPGEGGVEALQLIGLHGRLQTPKVAPQLRVATPAHLPLPFTRPH